MTDCNHPSTAIEYADDKCKEIERLYCYVCKATIWIKPAPEKIVLNIDYELIKTMRANGQVLEANSLLEAWKNNNEKQKITDKKFFTKQITKKNRFLKKNNGVCVVEGCYREGVPGKTLCQYHREYYNNFYKLRKKK